MRINFRSLVLASAAIAATAIATIPAQAATEGSATISVPFSFTIGTKNLPAGDYLVERNDNGNFIKLADSNRKQTYTWVARAEESKSSHVSMIFDVRGDSHALQSIQYGSLTTPRIDHKRSVHEMESEQIVPGQ